METDIIYTKDHSGRRELRYDCLQDLLQEAEEIAEANNYKTVGNWTFPQILWHLNSSMVASLEGFPFMAPWYMRMMGKLIKRKILNMKLPPGIKLPGEAKSMIPPPDVTIEEGLQLIRVAVERMENETPDKKHPFIGQLEPEEWRHFQCNHAALHMSFVVPKEI